MMIVTGAAGFIGSCLISKLNQHNFNYIVAADRFDAPEKERNLHNKRVLHRVDIDDLPDWLDQQYRTVEFIFHLNDCSHKPADNQPDKLKELKLKFSKRLWQQSVAYQIPFLYISRETAGNGNPDHSFEQWAIKQEKKPFYWACLSLPEVYGPNEYYLGSEASIIYRKYAQWEKNSSRQAPFSWEHCPPVNLIYVKDVVEVCYDLMHYRKESGRYKLGTESLYTEQQIINSLAAALHIRHANPLTAKPVSRTEREITSAQAKLQLVGYERSFTSLAEGVQDYVQHYLKAWKYF